jgi:hypothetical protein
VDEDELEQALMHLFSLGLVSVDYDEELVARFAITNEARLRLLIEDMGGNTDNV